MGYDALATTLNSKKTTFETSIQNIKNISFDTIWSGQAYTKLTTDLTTTMENLNTQKANIESFAFALQLLQCYKNNKEKQVAMQNQLSSIANTAENANAISSLVAQINNFTTTNENIKQRINTIFQSITPVNSTLEEVGYKVSGNLDYILDVQELYNLFATNQLTKLPDSGNNSLYDYYSEEEVEQYLNEIKSTYSGRDAAVNCALGIMQLAANVGLKLDYDWGGGHTAVTSNSAIATGVDCSAFASWAINQGSTNTFETRTTGGLISVGERVDYSEAQKGDILVYNNGENGHVVVVIENNPETQTFIVAEAAGSDTGVILKERSYSSLSSSSYQARDLSSIYNN